MAVQYTFGGLLSLMRTILDRQDVTNAILGFGINTAFQRIQRVARLPNMEVSVPINQVAGSDYFPVPDDILELKHILTPNGALEYRTLDWMVRQPAMAGAPKYYSRSDEIFQVYPVPAEDMTITLIYFAQFGPLSNEDDTNNLIKIAFDVVLYGALSVVGELYVDERVSTWEERFQQETQELIKQAVDWEMRGTPMAILTPEGSEF